MRYYFVFIILFCVISFCSCNKYNKSKVTEFFLVKQTISSTGVYEAFVVSNPPIDSLLLRNYIEYYNLNTIPLNLLKKNKNYIRSFYRESKFLTRNYKDGEPDKNPNSPYTYQDLSHFLDDQLMTTRYNIRYDGTYRYWSFFYGNVRYSDDVIIHDLDSFYHAKWIETADIDTTMIK